MWSTKYARSVFDERLKLTGLCPNIFQKSLHIPGMVAEVKFIDGKPTFQSIIDHISSNNSCSQSADGRVSLAGANAGTGAMEDLATLSGCDVSVVVRAWSFSPEACAALDPSLDGSARIRAIICSTAALVLRTGSCDPSCRSNRNPVQSISKQSPESWLLWCTAASASTKHALSR